MHFPHRHHHPEEGGHEHGHHGGRHGGRPGGGGRIRRGEAKYVILDALKDNSRHGYEIIKALEERSGGRYAPSPGMVYPTLQFLEEAGMVCSEASGDRKVFSLTEAGRADLITHREEVEAFWSLFVRPTLSAESQTELGFLREEMQFLQRTLWSGLRDLPSGDNPDAIRRIRQTVEKCRNDVRAIFAEKS